MSYIVKFVILLHCMFFVLLGTTPSKYNPCAINLFFVLPKSLTLFGQGVGGGGSALIISTFENFLDM